MSSPRAVRVAIIYKWIPQYRLEFFEELRLMLFARDIELHVIYGSPSGMDAKRKDHVELTWGTRIGNKRWRILGQEVYWQPCLGKLHDADLVIVEQANRLLLNYVLLFRQAFGRTPVAFWGHGRNHQAGGAKVLSEGLKRLLLRAPRWWFVYTSYGARLLLGEGYPMERITVVNNSLDTVSLHAGRERINEASTSELRHELGLAGENVCAFCGSMYPGRQLELLIEACRLIRSEVTDFEMLFIGSGPELSLITDAARKYPWMHVVGTAFGEKKARYLSLAKLLLIPASVGLSVIDSFVMRVPLVTTASGDHGPEIEYVTSGENGVILSDAGCAAAYATEVIRLLSAPEEYERLIQGCVVSSELYTLENMVQRFADGISKALES